MEEGNGNFLALGLGVLVGILWCSVARTIRDARATEEEEFIVTSRGRKIFVQVENKTENVNAVSTQTVPVPSE